MAYRRSSRGRFRRSFRGRRRMTRGRVKSIRKIRAGRIGYRL